MERDLFQTSLMLLVYSLTNGQDIMGCKGGGPGEILKMGHYHGTSIQNYEAICRRQ
jgi:hypothetical protein